MIACALFALAWLLRRLVGPRPHLTLKALVAAAWLYASAAQATAKHAVAAVRQRLVRLASPGAALARVPHVPGVAGSSSGHPQAPTPTCLVAAADSASLHVGLVPLPGSHGGMAATQQVGTSRGMGLLWQQRCTGWVGAVASALARRLTTQ